MVFQMLLNTFFFNPFYIFIDLLLHVNIIYIGDITRITLWQIFERESTVPDAHFFSI